MPSPSLLPLLQAPPLTPRLASSSSSNPSLKTLPPPRPAPRLRPPAATARRPRATGVARAAGEDGGGGGGGELIPVARCYEGRLARLELAGAARREQAVAAAAAVDGGAAAEAHLAAGAEAMVIEASLPGPDGGERGAVSTRVVILQAKEVKDKARKIKKDFGSGFFSENEPDSESILAMAFKQVVMQRLSNFKLEVFSPGSERDFQDLGKPKKVATSFIISSSDEKLLPSLAEAIFSCVIEDAGKNYLGPGSSLQKRQLNCSTDSSVCVHRLFEAEVVRTAKRCLKSFNLLQSSSHKASKAKNEWWPAPNYQSLVKMGGPEFVLWASEYIPTYKVQINAKAFENTNFEGCHELANNRWEILLAHLQLVELGNVLDMYFEDQFTVPGKTFRPLWNLYPSKIKKNNVYLRNFFPLLAGSCIVLFVAIIAQLCLPQSLRDKKRLFTISSNVSSFQSYCSDIHSLDNIEVETYCTSVVKNMKDSFGCPGDIMFDANIGAWVGELPDCFKGINGEYNTASDDIQYPNAYSHEYEPELVPSNVKMAHLEQSYKTKESLQNIASFQVVMSEEGKVVGFQPTNRLAVIHWATNPLARLLYQGRSLGPGFLEPRLKISRPAKVIPIELLTSVDPESFFALARPIQDPC
ncbi:hypothetical protein ACP4OV_021792 [Aristida adscensionis]